MVNVKQARKSFRVFIGPPKLTVFEKARIVGARALQLSLGAPPFIPLEPYEHTSTIELSLRELKAKALPISIRRSLPNGVYQDIPLKYINVE